jgi:hypothetical protein
VPAVVFASRAWIHDDSSPASSCTTGSPQSGQRMRSPRTSTATTRTSAPAAVEEQSITTSQIAGIAASSSHEISSAGEDAGRSADELTRLAHELDGLVAQPA